MNLLDASKAQDWVTYDTLYADTNNIEAGGTLSFMLPVMFELVRHKQKDRFRKFLNYYVDQDYDPRDLVKYVGWAAVQHDSYAALKMMHVGLRRYPPYFKTPDDKQHLNLILWLGMDGKIPDRRLLKMLKLAAMNRFTFHEGESVPKLPDADSYFFGIDNQSQNTRAWVAKRIAKEQIEYCDLDTHGGPFSVSTSS